MTELRETCVMKPILIQQRFIDKHVLDKCSITTATCDLHETVVGRTKKVQTDEEVLEFFLTYFVKQLIDLEDQPMILCLQNVEGWVYELEVWKDFCSSFYPNSAHDEKTKTWTGLRDRNHGWEEIVHHEVGLYTTYCGLGIFNSNIQGQTRIQFVNAWVTLSDFLRNQSEPKQLLVGPLCQNLYTDRSVLQEHFPFLPHIVPDTKLKRWTSKAKGPVRHCGRYSRRGSDVWDQLVIPTKPCVFVDNRAVSVGSFFTVVLSHMLLCKPNLEIPFFTGQAVFQGYVHPVTRHHVRWYQQLRSACLPKYDPVMQLFLKSHRWTTRDLMYELHTINGGVDAWKEIKRKKWVTVDAEVCQCTLLGEFVTKIFTTTKK